MKQENLKRARYLEDEILATTHNVEVLTTQLTKEITGIKISEYNDSSGWTLKTVYYNGNHPEKLHKKIMESMLDAYTEHLELLMVELETL